MIDYNIYIDGNSICKLQMPKIFSKMYVFKDADCKDFMETKWFDFRLLEETTTSFGIYYIDEYGNYWKKEKCYFNLKLAEEEKNKRIEKYFNNKIVEV